MNDLTAIVFYCKQAEHRVNGTLAAAKVCELADEEELDDFTVEIDILSSMQHRNIVTLLEAYFINARLWVSDWLVFHVFACGGGREFCSDDGMLCVRIAGCCRYKSCCSSENDRERRWWQQQCGALPSTSVATVA